MIDELLAQLRQTAEELQRFGGAEQAAAIHETCHRVGQGLAEWWNTPLTNAQASEWGGYSESQLRRLIHEGQVPVAPGGGIRRRNVPVRPGHQLPIGIEPAQDVAWSDWATDLVARRQRSGT